MYSFFFLLILIIVNVYGGKHRRHHKQKADRKASSSISSSTIKNYIKNHLSSSIDSSLSSSTDSSLSSSIDSSLSSSDSSDLSSSELSETLYPDYCVNQDYSRCVKISGCIYVYHPYPRCQVYCNGFTTPTGCNNQEGCHWALYQTCINSYISELENPENSDNSYIPRLIQSVNFLMSNYGIQQNDESIKPPNINQLGFGYNIVRGNPHPITNGISRDPGYRSPVFDIYDYTSGRISDQYLVPDGTTIINNPQCSMQFKYNAISGSESYSNSLSQSIKADAKYNVYKFSASESYQTVTKDTEQHSSMYISSYTNCGVYTGILNIPNDLPKFSNNFIQTIKDMPKAYETDSDKDWFWDFFEVNFGTHYLRSVTFGGRYGYLYQMEKSAFSKFESSNLKIDASASYSCLNSASVTTMNEYEQEASKDFESVISNKFKMTGGGKISIPTDGSPETWLESLESNPIPMLTELRPITDLLTKRNFPLDDDIEEKETAFSSALDEYCERFSVKDPDLKIQCSGLPRDIIPGKSIFGGLYGNNDQSDQPTNAYTDTYSCFQGYTSYEIFKFLSYNGESIKTNLCLQNDINIDPMNYFGGMYSQRFISSGSDPESYIVNPLTHEDKCVDGYESINIAIFSEYLSEYPQVYLYSCYNDTTDYSKGIIGGFYQTGNIAKIDNQYTLGPSCPIYFSPYKFIDYHGNDVYVCLNNVYKLPPTPTPPTNNIYNQYISGIQFEPQYYITNGQWSYQMVASTNLNCGDDCKIYFKKNGEWDGRPEALWSFLPSDVDDYFYIKNAFHHKCVTNGGTGTSAHDIRVYVTGCDDNNKDLKIYKLTPSGNQQTVRICSKQGNCLMADEDANDRVRNRPPRNLISETWYMKPFNLY